MSLPIPLQQELTYSFEFYMNRSKQSNKAELERTYNLYADGFLSLQSPATETPKPDKKEIQIIFHHPNLLYLKKDREKGRDEISRQIGENIVRDIKRKNMKSSRKEGSRPKTSDPWANNTNSLLQNKDQNRAKTSQEPKRRKINHRSSNNQEKLEVFGKSSTFLGAFFDPSAKTLEPTKTRFASPTTILDSPKVSPPKKPSVLEILESASPSSQKQLWRKLFTSKRNKSSVRLNMCLSMQKKYLKYNTQKLSATCIARKTRPF